MTPFDLIGIAKRANSVEELVSLANANKIKLSDEDAQIYFDRWHSFGELSDAELEAVGGGAGQNFSVQVVCEYCLKGDRLSISMSSGGAYFCERCNRYCSGRQIK